jgi:hypothetical protein
MEKLKIKLNKGVHLKNVIERSIEADNEIIQSKNSILEENKREVDIDQIDTLKNLKSEFLIELGLIIQLANFNRGRGERRSNAYYIKKLSEIQRELSHLKRIKIKDGWIFEDGEKVKYKAYLTHEEITARQKSLSVEVEKLQNKLTKFNTESTIEFQYDPLLADVIKSAGIEI